MGYFVFNGIRSDEMGLVISKKPDYTAPERLMETFVVPGRNGVLKMATGAFGNTAAKYECWFHGSAEQCHAIKAWLLGAPGYCRLADSYDPDHFRLAGFDGPMEVGNILGRGLYGQFTLAFDCKPQNFLQSGTLPVTLTSSGRICNPTPFTALPLLRIYGTGTVTVNNTACTVNSCDAYVDLDSETMQASKGAVNCNANVSVPEFPQLANGLNAVGIVGPAKVEITPRWWTV